MRLPSLRYLANEQETSVRPRTKAGWIARLPDASSGMRLGERFRRLLKQIRSAIGHLCLPRLG